MFLLHLLMLISGALSEKSSESAHFHTNICTGDIWIKMYIQKSTIVIKDSASGTFTSDCMSAKKYVECTTMNVTSTVMDYNINVHTSKTDQFVFNISSFTCQVTNCTLTAISALLKAVKGHPDGLMTLKRIQNMQRMCSTLFRDNTAMKMLYIGVERGVIQNIMNNSFSGDSVSYNLENLSMTVSNLTNLTSVNGNIIQIKAPENGDYISETWIPTDAFKGIAEDQKKVSVVIYKLPNQFLLNNSTVMITPVMRIEAFGDILKNLITPLKMKFQLLNPESISVNYSASCQYFNEYGNISIPNNVFWKTDGCQTKTDGNMVECSCSHATPFAVLLVPNMPYDDKNWQILSYLTYIGCGLSAFFTALSLITYCYSRNTRADNSIGIHVSLSGALFLLNTFFMLNEWGASLGINGVCIFIAVAIHYSLLSSFTWMAIEAVHLCILLKMFTDYRHYMAKLSAIGWGVPGVVVGISLAFQNTQHFYGSTGITLANSNKTNTICWITNVTFFYGVNLGYFAIVFVMNSGILLTVITQICRLKCHKNKQKTGKGSLAFNDICTVLGLTCLLGITWGLAFLSIGYYNLVILYLFSIFNSLQGFFIFLWFCGSTRKERELGAIIKSTSLSMNDSTSETKDGILTSETSNPYK